MTGRQASGPAGQQASGLAGQQASGLAGQQASGLAGQQVLIVGGLGFIGVNLAARVAAAGARVSVLTPNRLKHADAAAAFERQGITIIEGDLRDQPRVEQCVEGQELIFNLSGQSGAVRSMEDPWTDLDVNLRGNLVLLEALRARNRDAKVIFAGSRLEYGHQDDLPVREDAIAQPLCIHAIHKQTVEQYLQLYARLFGIRYATARITNPYGPGQPRGRTAYGIINRMIQLAIAGSVLTIYGDGSQQRDYVHVDDVADALMAIASSSAADGRLYNVASGTGISLIALARQIVSIAGAGRIEHVAWPALAEQIETGDFIADVSRIRDELGWQPRIALRDGLERTVSFYRGAPSGE